MAHRAAGSPFKLGGPMMESKTQMKYFTAVDLDFPQNGVGQAHQAHTLNTALSFSMPILENVTFFSAHIKI